MPIFLIFYGRDYDLEFSHLFSNDTGLSCMQTINKICAAKGCALAPRHTHTHISVYAFTPLINMALNPFWQQAPVR